MPLTLEKNSPALTNFLLDSLTSLLNHGKSELFVQTRTQYEAFAPNAILSC